MTLTGQSLVAGQWIGDSANGEFNAFSPARNEPLSTRFFNLSAAELDGAIAAAQSAFYEYRKTSFAQRADFLTCIADHILALGDELLEQTHQETNLPMMRLQGERMRTVNQLKAFASALRENPESPLGLKVVDEADAARAPLPKPHTELNYLPLGPVAVFGASNFPYAFSTLGGDTAAALAAGCPVIVKNHTAHPGTGELMARAALAAIKECAMPLGVFAMVQSKAYDMSHQLVAAPEIKAVGFTGSFNVASKLQATIAKREEPIPFYGELGSINPQVILPNKAIEQSKEIAQSLCQSMLMGNGQFCTSPGLWLVPTGCDELEAHITACIDDAPSDTLLTPGIVNTFKHQIAARSQLDKVSVLGAGKLAKAFHANAHVFACNGDDYLATPALQEEVFGPAALVVRYDSEQQLMTLVNQLQGQLTASVHGTDADLNKADSLIEALQYKVGRLIKNQMPTGVEVCGSMNHGGPFPSSTDVRSTSVGTNAILRFMRPICYQA
ncbi:MULTISPECIES: aldehyde dehydrogenase (NADP(+)) [unclassified Pseudoalteromonas]|uniref:aldehyde dehydrogenase (NADP(+)) n=1 Tax=unclassified Pseudoalteromonas TaxID=194690 RepID=UPI000C06C306|nr:MULTISPECIES: aldehyde dehydrogenase (NADP(+)) [unclassified Pseudoalteromonas]MDP2635149.1 aldehyde dehydrogenase (NADP(+)) [Pseudoalteromonas sp. 1_MG-2023]PHN91506.1 aldehyde dehydrogenase [Pseudoalteromonas sp. 3D05]